LSEKERKCQIQFSIVPPNQAHYVAETKIIATPLQVAQLQSGQAITVHIDPNNPQNTVLPTGHNP
jgi:hypothetical protein